MTNLNRGMGSQEGIFPDVATLQAAKFRNGRIIGLLDGSRYVTVAEDSGSDLPLASGNYAKQLIEFSPLVNLGLERLLTAFSEVNQNPTGLGIANAIQASAGPAQGTTESVVMIAADGTITFNVGGLYRVKAQAQFGRTGATGVSNLLFRQLVNGVQTGMTVAVKLENAETVDYIESDNWIYVPAGTELTFEVMRDNAGNNSGGLVAAVPTDEGAGTWINSYSTRIIVDRFIGI